MLGRPARKLNLLTESIPALAGNIDCAPEPPSVVAAMFVERLREFHEIRRNAPRLRAGNKPLAPLLSRQDNQEIAMRPSLFILGIFAVAFFGAQPAKADGAWCADYKFHHGGARNCGFATYQQCLATVTGIGGSCGPNPFYQPPGPPRYTRLPRHNPY